MMDQTDECKMVPKTFQQIPKDESSTFILSKKESSRRLKGLMVLQQNSAVCAVSVSLYVGLYFGPISGPGTGESCLYSHTGQGTWKVSL